MWLGWVLDITLCFLIHTMRKGTSSPLTATGRDIDTPWFPIRMELNVNETVSPDDLFYQARWPQRGKILLSFDRYDF